MRDLEAQLRAYGVVLDRADALVTDVVDVGSRPSRRSMLVAIAAVVVAAVALATFAVVGNRSGNAHRPNIVTPGSSQPAPPSTARATDGPTRVLAIGDSVMLGAKVALEGRIPGIAVDAVVSRQFAQATDVLTQYAQFGTLPSTIVVGLGTNGLPTQAELDAFMRVASGRTVYFLTVRVPRTWESATNELLRAMPDRWPNAHVIDWHDYANGHDEWFVEDGFHLRDVGQAAYAELIATQIGTSATTPLTGPANTSALDIVDVIPEQTLPTDPLAVAGGDVWIATESHSDTSSVHLEGRDPTTVKVVRTIDVPQEAVFAIAGDGDTLWVAGGGDGGVPQTSVSKIDLTTNTVVFTKTLSTSCSCPIVAGSAGVWLLGNGSSFALRLSPADGHVIRRVDFASLTVGAVTEVGGRLLVGLDDGSIAVIDPDTYRIEHSIPLPVIGDPPVEHAVAMNAATIPAIGSDPAVDALVARSGGDVDALSVSGWQVNSVLAADFQPTTVVNAGAFAWVLGADRLEVSSTHAEVNSEFSYDPTRGFTRSPKGYGSQPFGFRAAVVAGDTLWAAYDPGPGNGVPSIVVVRIPVGLP